MVSRQLTNVYLQKCVTTEVTKNKKLLMYNNTVYKK